MKTIFLSLFALVFIKFQGFGQNNSRSTSNNDKPLNVLVNIRNSGVETSYTNKIKDLFIFSFIEKSSWQVSDNSVSNTHTIKETKYDYLVRAENRSNGKEFILNFQIVTKQDSVVSLPNIVCYPGEIYGAVNRMAGNVFDKIRIIETLKGRVKTIAIVPANSTALKLQRFLLELDEKPANRIHIIQWAVANKFYSKGMLSDNDIFQKTGSDAILKIYFEQDKALSVRSELTIRNPKVNIELPGILLESSKPEVLSYVQQDIHRFFEYIVDTTGQWSTRGIESIKSTLSVPLSLQKEAVDNLFLRREWIPAAMLCYKAIAEGNGDPEIYAGLTYMLIKQNQREQARYFAEAGLAKNPSDNGLLFLRGYTLAFSGQYNAALQSFKNLAGKGTDL